MADKTRALTAAQGVPHEVLTYAPSQDHFGEHSATELGLDPAAVTPAAIATAGGVAEALGRGTRNEIVRVIRRRLASRLGRNLASLAPLVAGAVAGAEVNRRATRSLGEAVVRDLAAIQFPS